MFIRVRLEAGKLARSLRKSLRVERDRWKIDQLELDGAERPCIAMDRFKIALVPQRLRLVDTIHVYCDGAEVWLPLIARMRLRGAARWFLARHGNDHLQPKRGSEHKHSRRFPVRESGDHRLASKAK